MTLFNDKVFSNSEKAMRLLNDRRFLNSTEIFNNMIITNISRRHSGSMVWEPCVSRNSTMKSTVP